MSDAQEAIDSVPNHRLFTNRELAYLAYNRRIVEEAADPTVPLLQRLRFAALVGANLDAFFMARVAGLKQQVKSGVLETGPDGLLASQQLTAVRVEVKEQVASLENVLLDELMPALETEGIRISSVSGLGKMAQARLKVRFETEIFPILTPLAVDPGHPFPFLKNCSLNLAVHLVPSTSPDVGSYPLLAVVQVPSQLPRFMRIDSSEGQALVLIEDLIRHHVGQLFHGMRIEQCVPFRVVRNWDLNISSDEQEDLLTAVQKELQNRWRNDVVYMEIDASAHVQLTDRLMLALGLAASDVQHHRGPVGLADFLALVESSGSKGWGDDHGPLGLIGRPDLRDELFQPVPSPAFSDDQNIFDTLAEKELLEDAPAVRWYARNMAQPRAL
ncbi:MAG: hypothetical protein AAF449_17975, partial [Myxococcota bacterium]